MTKKLMLIWMALILLGSAAQSQTVTQYVEEHTDHAQELMRAYDVPASVILAVAIHESAAGKSKVARHLNNHFGIKGANSNAEINSSYRDFESADESYDNFVEVLQNKSSFSKLFDECDQYDYAAWAKGIQRGGYASSRTWAKQVIAIINKYELYQYDERPDDYAEPVKIAPVSFKKHHSRSYKAKKHRSSVQLYTVRKGDNLNKIAESHGTSSKLLMRKNGLKKSALKPGQKIKL
ncbi:Hemagglutinin [Pedobacter cryoconitis]|uniref:Peptidoglycan hydrolase n=2 Tax=Pedobacter cryoconitis TaxID=188932 RepID=A0A127VIH1_9SPHI|nr:Hemagglutinin [Pedobacter cryoconitis]